MINKLLNLFKNLSITQNIKFADKSYKYDTLFFAVQILSKYAEQDIIKIDRLNRVKIIAEFTKRLQLNTNDDSYNADSNYLSESLSLFTITGVLEKIDSKHYKIKDKSIFDFIGMCMETAYIFQYLLAYKLFINDNIWNLYCDYCNKDFENKKPVFEKIKTLITKLLPNKGWADFQIKFFMMVLGLANQQNKVARTTNLINEEITPEHLANRQGTRTITTKDNEYSEKFKLETVQFYLKDYLAFNFVGNGINIEPLKRYTLEPMSDEMLQLKNELNSLNDDNENDIQIANELIKRNEKLIEKSSKDSESINKINFENLKKQVVTYSRKRDKFIAELSKKKANYRDEFDNSESFEGKDGKNYVESHHIIEFNTELGPDISLNLICLNPLHHSLIHHGSLKAIQAFFKECREKGVITLNRFENMCIKYQCLTNKHVQILLNKCLITEEESYHLYDLIRIFGCANAPKPINNKN